MKKRNFWMIAAVICILTVPLVYAQFHDFGSGFGRAIDLRNTYESNRDLWDFLIFFAIFIGLVKAVFEKRFGDNPSSNAFYVSLGLALAWGAVYGGLSIGTMAERWDDIARFFWPLLVVLLAGGMYKLLNLLNFKGWMAFFIAILTSFIMLWSFFGIEYINPGSPSEWLFFSGMAVFLILILLAFWKMFGSEREEEIRRGKGGKGIREEPKSLSSEQKRWWKIIEEQERNVGGWLKREDDILREMKKLIKGLNNADDSSTINRARIRLRELNECMTNINLRIKTIMDWIKYREIRENLGPYYSFFLNSSNDYAYLLNWLGQEFERMMGEKTIDQSKLLHYFNALLDAKNKRDETIRNFFQVLREVLVGMFGSVGRGEEEEMEELPREKKQSLLKRLFGRRKRGKSAEEVKVEEQKKEEQGQKRENEEKAEKSHLLKQLKGLESNIKYYSSLELGFLQELKIKLTQAKSDRRFLPGRELLRDLTKCSEAWAELPFKEFEKQFPSLSPILKNFALSNNSYSGGLRNLINEIQKGALDEKRIDRLLNKLKDLRKKRDIKERYVWLEIVKKIEEELGL